MIIKVKVILRSKSFPVADPGFLVGGGAEPLGGTDLQHKHFSVKMNAKMKELDPVGGGTCRQRPLDPPMNPDSICKCFEFYHGAGSEPSTGQIFVRIICSISSCKAILLLSWLSDVSFDVGVTLQTCFSKAEHDGRHDLKSYNRNDCVLIVICEPYQGCETPFIKSSSTANVTKISAQIPKTNKFVSEYF